MNIQHFHCSYYSIIKPWKKITMMGQKFFYIPIYLYCVALAISAFWSLYFIIIFSSLWSLWDSHCLVWIFKKCSSIYQWVTKPLMEDRIYLESVCHCLIFSCSVSQQDLVKVHTSLLREIQDSVLMHNASNLHQIFIKYKERWFSLAI